MERTAALFGATGVVGMHCLRQLCLDPAFTRIVAIGRSAPQLTDPKLISIECALGSIPSLQTEATGRADDVFCCLGTTQARAGSTPAFQAVDRDAVVAACEFAVRAGARNYLMVSAVGASARSPILYNRTKGEAEDACRALADRIHVSIFRPSLLLGKRDEFRIKEALAEPAMRALSPLMVGPLAKFRPIEARAVAMAMITIAKRNMELSGTTIYEGDEIAKLGL